MNISVDTYTVWTAPFAFRRLLKFRFQTDKMVGPRARVTENDFTALLTHFTVILVVGLRTNHIAAHTHVLHPITSQHTLHSPITSQHTHMCYNQSQADRNTAQNKPLITVVYSPAFHQASSFKVKLQNSTDPQLARLKQLAHEIKMKQSNVTSFSFHMCLFLDMGINMQMTVKQL